jgi:hypothetical protein
MNDRSSKSPTVKFLRDSRPIEREVIAHKPVRNVFAIDRAYRDRAPILTPADTFAPYGLARNMLVKFIRRLSPASILQAVVTATKLARLGRVDTLPSRIASMT